MNTDERRPNVRALLEVLGRELDARETLAGLARIADRAGSEVDWEGLGSAPIDAELDHLTRMLLDEMERESSSDALTARLYVTEWRGRAEGCELELNGGRWSSALLSEVVRAACGGPDWLACELPLACGATLLRATLERIEPALVLGERELRELRIEFPTGLGLYIGLIGEAGLDASEPSFRLDPGAA